MKFPASAILFRTLGQNMTMVPTGSVVEFVGYASGYDANDEAQGFGPLQCRDAFSDDLNPKHIVGWHFRTRDLVPLTDIARRVLRGVE